MLSRGSSSGEGYQKEKKKIKNFQPDENLLRRGFVARARGGWAAR